MAWIEGVSTSSTFLRDVAHMMTHANKLADGTTIDPAKNWELIFPSPYDYGSVVDVADEQFTGLAAITLANKPISQTMPLAVRHLQWDGVSAWVTVALVKDTDYTVDYELGEITVLGAVAAEDKVSIDYSYIVPSLSNAIAQITDRFVTLTKTTTSAVPEENVLYNATVQTVSQINMYAEFQMPRNLVNPETNTPDYKDLAGVLKGTDRNRHYCQARMFDAWDKTAKTPTTSALVSEWAKLSWLRDFREVLSTDASGSSPTTTSRPYFAQTKIAVNLADMPIQFWINVDNDRLTGVVAGESSIDPDNALVSFVYLGTLDQIEATQADVIGNFALISSSSTLPTLTAGNPTTEPVLTYVDETASSVSVPGSQPPSYVLSYLTDSGESPASKPYMHTFATSDRKFAIRMRVSGIPAEARTLRLYRNIVQRAVVDRNADKLEEYANATGSEFSFNHNLVSHNGTWKVTVAREGRYTSGYTTYLTYGTEYEIPAEGYLIESNNIKVATAELANAVAVGNPTGRFRLRVNTMVEDPSVKYGDGSNWELVYETSDTTTEFITDNGLTGDPVFKPYTEGRPTPGVKRDANGRVTEVKFPTKWGANTATGVLDISMLKTKTGVPFQKHFASFVAASKSTKMEAVNPSRWTDKVHLSPVYVLHPFDGYRGKLRDVLVVPRRSLVHLDELIVDKDLPSQKTYKLFRVNSPFSIFVSSAFPAIGVAIRKS